MKLWLKISMIAVSLMAAAMIICSTILVLSSRKRELNRAVANAVDEHTLFCTYFQQGVYDNISSGLSMTVQKSILKYVFANHSVKYASNSKFSLFLGSEFIYNEADIDPVSASGLAASDTTQHAIRQLGSADILFVAKSLNIAGETYTVYLTQDITDIFHDMNVFLRQTIAINCAVILLSTIVMFLLVRFALRPLKELENGSTRIAKGIYDKRIDIRTKDEIGQVALSFNRMAEAIQSKIAELSAASAKTKHMAEQQKMFIAHLTHELKTPMTSMIGYSEALLSFRMTEEQRERALLFLNRECRRLESLSQKLMQILIVENREIVCSQVRVCALFENVRLAMQKPLHEKKLQLEIKAGFSVLKADMDLMTSALSNLVDNAVKASEPGRMIALFAYERDGKKILEVKDHGKGIPKDRLHIVATPFYRGTGADKKDGVGLGLSLVQTIAHLHNASIEIESKLGEGTAVRIIF